MGNIPSRPSETPQCPPFSSSWQKMNNDQESSSAADAYPSLGESNCRVLPQDLLERVLLQLPLDCWARFRLVCKHWNKLLRNQEFYLQRDPEPWILSFLDYSLEGQAYSLGRKSWSTINLHGMHNHVWHGLFLNEAVVSDGGLICYNNFVVNVLTGCTRILDCPLPRDQLKVSAIATDRGKNSYMVLFLAKRCPYHRRYYHLEIYESKKNFWRKSQECPDPFDTRASGVVFNGFVYFVWRANDIVVDFYLKLVCYDLTNDEWRVMRISPHRVDARWVRILHEWQNSLYLISMCGTTAKPKAIAVWKKLPWILEAPNPAPFQPFL